MSYTSSSAADRLAAVRATIDKVLSSQAYSVGSRNQRLAELRSLREMEKELQAECGQSAGGFTVGQIDPPN